MIRFLTQTSSRSHQWGRLLAFATTLSAAGCHSGSMAMDDPTVQTDPLTDLDRYVKAKDPSYT